MAKSEIDASPAGECTGPAEAGHDVPALRPVEPTVEALTHALGRETGERRRAECMAHIQTGAVRLALDALVREPDIAGFFRAFITQIAEESESHGCAVWLLDSDAASCDMWMAYLDGRMFMQGAPDGDTIAVPRAAFSSHLLAYRPGWTETTEYAGDDVRLPHDVREYNRQNGVKSVVIAPLVLPTRNLGWFALSSTDGDDQCELAWRRALLEAMARQATLALHQSQLAEQSRVEARRQAVLEERNRMARDIHDTLAQGFGAILMQLQAAQRSAASLPLAIARNIDTAVELARTHLVDARRSVAALRPQTSEAEDIAAALHRITDLARRTTDVPIFLSVSDVPPLGGGVNREIIGIAQEALTNAVRHSRARKISVNASGVRSVGFRLSVADDGRGIAKEHRGAGFGMTSMQERAERIGASLTIVTAPRSGTEVVLAWEPPSFNIPAGADAAS